ncbi:L,D-transpeptidase [Streptomyces yaizuensis]|uniref:L,D-transpeptidase n=1 Tax=Streptomyces yaizuensis TaxID=2989713 RepID=A0ABQ5NY00_9ACTN|nr:L,D-transpeptidase [Streptomyces sp. YSPA8]GLF95232.1 L,D-transpeptidase [Streptomyces sp. YSPA8]
MSSTARHLRAAVIAVAMTSTLALAPAAAAQKPAAAPTPSGPTRLVFDKNWQKPSDSRLRVYKGATLWAEYRAGSGLGSTNDCARSRGWIPDGTWKIRLKSRTYNGKVIKGYAIYLEDMKCSAGTASRTEMFIHSEMNRDGTQGRGESRRWDGDGDYESNGCVKLHPEDIKKMFRLFTREDFGWPTHLRVAS